VEIHCGGADLIDMQLPLAYCSADHFTAIFAAGQIAGLLFFSNIIEKIFE